MTGWDEAVQWVNERTAAALGAPRETIGEPGVQVSDQHPFDVLRKLFVGENVDVQEALTWNHSAVMQAFTVLSAAPVTAEEYGGDPARAQMSAMFFLLAQHLLLGYRIGQQAGQREGQAA